MTKRRTNLAASVRQRLLNLAQERNEEFQQVITRFALERLLYRLASSEYAERFVLKGALLFRLWFDLEQRPTRDADFLGFGSAEPNDLALIFREVSAIKPDYDDGIHFNIDSVEAQEIRKGQQGIQACGSRWKRYSRVLASRFNAISDLVTRSRRRRWSNHTQRFWTCRHLSYASTRSKPSLQRSSRRL